MLAVESAYVRNIRVQCFAGTDGQDDRFVVNTGSMPGNPKSIGLVRFVRLLVAGIVVGTAK